MASVKQARDPLMRTLLATGLLIIGYALATYGYYAYVLPSWIGLLASFALILIAGVIAIINAKHYHGAYRITNIMVAALALFVVGSAVLFIAVLSGLGSIQF